MILGRPTNLWTGLATAVLGVVSVFAINVLRYDPETVALITASLATLFGAVIAVVAVQPPTVNTGSSVNVTTPSGQPNATATLGVTPQGNVTADTTS
ncbi:MAG TPA: hypothetical protein VJT72_13345 [Pseudonocardiaceae bacterium]|nr:hypothetical protein [Pseudonocardiaceae bacterium]